MDNVFTGILRPENIVWDKSAAQEQKAAIDKANETEYTKWARKNKRRGILFFVMFFVFAAMFIVSCAVSEDVYEKYANIIILIGVIGCFGAVATGVTSLFIASGISEYYGVDYPDGVTFCELTKGYTVDPSPFKRSDSDPSRVSIELMLVDDTDNVVVKKIMVQYALKKGIAEPTLDLSGVEGLFYIPYSPLDATEDSSVC